MYLICVRFPFINILISIKFLITIMNSTEKHQTFAFIYKLSQRFKIIPFIKLKLPKWHTLLVFHFSWLYLFIKLPKDPRKNSLSIEYVFPKKLTTIFLTLSNNFLFLMVRISFPPKPKITQLFWTSYQMLFVKCHQSNVTSQIASVKCHLSNGMCEMSRVKCRMLPITCQMSWLTYSLSPAKYQL